MIGKIIEDYQKIGIQINFLSSHSFILRNPTIFNIFYLAVIDESVGSGTERLIEPKKIQGF